MLPIIFFVVIPAIALILSICVKRKNKKKQIVTNENLNIFNNYLVKEQIPKDNLEKIFTIDSTFNIEDSIAVTGTVIKGILNVNDELKFVNSNSQIESLTITKIEKFNQIVSEAKEQEYVALHFSNLNPNINTGTYLFK